MSASFNPPSPLRLSADWRWEWDDWYGYWMATHIATRVRITPTGIRSGDSMNLSWREIDDTRQEVLRANA